MGEKTPPNILIITADQLRYDCIGSSGIRPVLTPHLDRLAGEGIVFTNAYSHFPVCGPARQSMLHGRRPETFGALWNFDASLPVASLQPSDSTWTQTLSENGYSSAFLGKWAVHPERDATAFGYDSYLGEGEYAKFLKQNYPDVIYSNGPFGETNPIPLEDAKTHWLANQAVQQLDKLQSEEGPWHLALHFSEPHSPCRPSGRFASMYDPWSVEEWPAFKETFENKPYIQQQHLHYWGVENLTWSDWAPIVARYYGIISQLDEAIGRVLEAVKDNNTIIIFTADHGDMCGSHRMMDKHYVLYDDVVRVPFIIRTPDCMSVNRICHEFVYSFLDLAPTLLELSGLSDKASCTFHGSSLAPLLRDGGELKDWRDSVVSTYNGQHFGLYNQRMIRTNKWKYIWNLTDIDELYDLELDPFELVNRVRDLDGSEVLQALRRQLIEQLRKDEDGVVVNNERMARHLLDGKN